MSHQSLFVLGATGYIGGSILAGIRAKYPSIATTVLVRSEKDVPAFASLGVKAILGSHADLEKIKEASSNADIVFNGADADDLPLTKAIIAGLQQRAKTAGIRPILLHTSGTGVVADKSEGELTEAAKKIWNDNSEDDIRSIAESQPHRLIDLEIFKADEEGIISAYIIAPSTIYGKGTGPVRTISQQVPGIIRLAIHKKQALYVGKGTGVWGNVHILDLIDIYLLVLQLALSGTDKNKGVGKFYFGSAREHVWGEVTKSIASILHKRGLVNTPEAASIPLSDFPKLAYCANNSRSLADRSFALGWKPVQKPLLDSLEEEVDLVIANSGTGPA